LGLFRDGFGLFGLCQLWRLRLRYRLFRFGRRRWTDKLDLNGIFSAIHPHRHDGGLQDDGDQSSMKE
jgi:hypothetical protein